MNVSRRSVLVGVAGAAVCPLVSSATAASDWALPRASRHNTGHVPLSGPSGSLGTDWTRSVDAHVTTTAMVRGDAAYLGTAAGTAVALETADGETRWERSIGATPMLAITATDDRLLVPTREGEVLALARSDGSVQWRRSVGDLHSPVATDGRSLAVGTEDGTVEVRDVATGDRRFSASVPTPVRSTPVLGDDLVVVRDEERTLAAFDRETGEERWRRVADARSPAVAFGGPVVRDGRLYVGAGTDASGTNEIAALAPADGSVEWTRQVEGHVFDLVASPERLFALYGDGVSALDPADGAVRWQREQDELVALASTPDALYSLGSEALTVYDPASGETLDRFDGTGALGALLGDEEEFGGRPVPIPGGVIVTDRDDDTIRALRGGTGVGAPWALLGGASVLGAGAYGLVRYRNRDGS